MAECGEALVVGVALAAEVQFRLIADANEKCAGSSGAYLVAPNRKRSVPMSKTGAVRRFVSDGGQSCVESSWKTNVHGGGNEISRRPHGCSRDANGRSQLEMDAEMIGFGKIRRRRMGRRLSQAPNTCP